jgi:cytidylate kinase
MKSNELVQSTLLITGIMASGKSTIAQHIAESLPNSVHLRGDVFRKMIVNGRAAIEPPLSQEAIDQLRLRYQLAAFTADQYCAAGFTVIYQDVIIGEILNEVITMHHKWPLYIVVLCPSPDVALKRDSTRHKQTYKSWTPHMLDQGLKAETPKVGLWLDTSSLSIDETVAIIHSQIDQAKLSSA